MELLEEMKFQQAPGVTVLGRGLSGRYATLGIICTNSYLSSHGAGGGNHQFQLHDFDAHTVLGTDYPKTVCPNKRTLRCGVEQTVN
jgi:hypothetical protein